MPYVPLIFAAITSTLVGCGSETEDSSEASLNNLHINEGTVTLAGTFAFPAGANASVLIDGQPAMIDGDNWSQTVSVTATGQEHSVQIDYVINGETVQSSEYVFQLDYDTTELFSNE